MRLNLGCGLHPEDGYVNADIAALPGVDVVCDLDAAPWPWPDESCEEIVASHLFEHIAHPVLFMAEAWRILTIGGLLDIRVPGGAYVDKDDRYWLPHRHSLTDPTHVRHCTPQTWDYWIPGQMLHEGYGYQMGSVKGGPRYSCDAVMLVGQEQEELRVLLRKLGDD